MYEEGKIIIIGSVFCAFAIFVVFPVECLKTVEDTIYLLIDFITPHGIALFALLPQFALLYINVRECIRLRKNKIKLEQLLSKPIAQKKFNTIETDCRICLSPIATKEEIYDICHPFHVDCIEEWGKKNQSCPLDRKPINVQKPKPKDVPSKKTSFNQETTWMYTLFLNDMIFDTADYCYENFADYFATFSRRLDFSRFLTELRTNITLPINVVLDMRNQGLLNSHGRRRLERYMIKNNITM